MFEKLIGNDRIKENLEKVLNSNNISHSYMFIGPSGIGKKNLQKNLQKEYYA